MIEQNDDLLMKNHESPPTMFAPSFEMNGTSFRNYGRGPTCMRRKDHHNH